MTMIVTIDRTAPEAPVLNPITSPVETSPVAVTGHAAGNSVVAVFLDGEEALLFVQPRDGAFSLDLVVEVGEHQLFATSRDSARNTSAPSNNVTFTSTADVTPPTTTTATVTPPTTTATVTPPTTTATVEDASGGQFKVSLSASDNPGGSGVSRTRYLVGQGTTWMEYEESFSVARDTVVRFYSSDLAGNVERIRSVTAGEVIGELDRVVLVPTSIALFPRGQETLSARGTDDQGHVLEDVTFTWELANQEAGTLDVLEAGLAQFTATTPGHYPQLITVRAEKDGVSQVATLDVTIPEAGTGIWKGKVLLEGRSAHGGVRVAVDGASVLTTDDGRFSVSILEGDYTVEVSAPGFLLARKLGVEVIAGQVAELDPVTLIAGDVDADGDIDREDLRIVSATLPGQSQNSPADLNDDGVVDVVDLALLAKNLVRSSLWP